MYMFYIYSSKIGTFMFGKQCNQFDNLPYPQCPEQRLIYSKCSIYVCHNPVSNQFMFVQNINPGEVYFKLMSTSAWQSVCFYF